MPQDLKAIVQRMIDSGESEDNIATVIRSQSTPELTEQQRADMNAFGDSAKPPGLMDRVAEMGQSMAHPQTVGDMAPLLLPNALGAALTPSIRAAAEPVVNAARTVGRVAARGTATLLEEYPPLRTMVPGAKQIAGVFRKMGTASPSVASDVAPVTQVPPTAAPAAATATASSLSAEERAGLVRQGYSPDLIAKIEQQAPVAKQGTLRMARPPIQADAASLPESPLQQPRVDIGAEKVGRQQGMSKQDVRDTTAPILDEAQGDASPIFPEQALKKMVDALKALPPGGPEREAYVARATSGKSKWQVENIRRTLEHLGLVAPLAVGAGMDGDVRRAVMQKLQSASEQPR